MRRSRWKLDTHVLDRKRILKGLTQQELAQIAHVDPGTLSDLFRGVRRPTFGTLQAVCTALGLGLSDAIHFEEDQENWRAA